MRLSIPTLSQAVKGAMILAGLALAGCGTDPTVTPSSDRGLQPKQRFVDTTLGDMAPLKVGNAWEYEIEETGEGCFWEQGQCKYRADTTLDWKVVTVLDSADRGGEGTRFTLRKRVTRRDSVQMDTTYTCTSTGNTVACDEYVKMGTFYNGYSTPAIHAAHRVTAKFKVDRAGGATAYRLTETSTTSGTKIWAPAWGLLQYEFTWPKGSAQGSAPTVVTKMRLRKFNGQAAPAA